jgi:hypothetical protein
LIDKKDIEEKKLNLNQLDISISPVTPVQKQPNQISFFTRMPHISEHIHEDDSENFEILSSGH